MGVFEKFPYTNFHDLNLDWILKNILTQNSIINSFVQDNLITYADPLAWDITSQYTKNTVVVDSKTGVAYLSKQAVPSGIEIENTDYWLVIFDFNQFPKYNETEETIIFRGEYIQTDTEKQVHEYDSQQETMYIKEV